MDKETLSNYGWIVICVLVMVVMIAFATPFGSFISGAVQSTTKGLFDVNKSALNSTGLINIDDQTFDVPDMNHGAGENGGNNNNNGGYNHAAPELHPNGVIPEGGTYTTAGGTVYNAGEAFPATVVTGDKYVYGDFTYCYNKCLNIFGMWMTDESQNGWGVSSNGDKEYYNPILETINNLPVTDMDGTFISRNLMIKAPEIPQYVNSMGGAFLNCKNLTEVPDIPAHVVNVANIFQGCSNLAQTVKMPCSVTTGSQTTGGSTPVVIEYYHTNSCDGSCGH